MILPQQIKPPLTIRVSVTDRCQLRCQYCMPADGVVPCRHEDILSFEEITLFIEQLQSAYDIEKVRLTGGDPLARRGMASFVSTLSGLGIPDVAMTTNAQRLADKAEALHAAGLDRVNISLDSLDPKVFRRITRGGDVKKTVDGIRAASQAGFTATKLNMVVMRGINDHEVHDITTFALGHGCELRFLELMPIGYGAKLFEEAFISSSDVLARLTPEFAPVLLPYERGSSAKRYRIKCEKGRAGTIGFISACSDPFCSGCTRLRLTSDGRLIGCLAREDGIPIRSMLKNPDSTALVAAVQHALQRKRSDKHFEQPMTMAAIGG